jgi:hypothetical protein
MVMMVELPVISQIQEVFSGECHEIIRHLTCFPVKVWFEKVIDAEPGGLCHKTPGPGDLSREQINRIDPAFPHGVSLKWPWHPQVSQAPGWPRPHRPRFTTTVKRACVSSTTLANWNGWRSCWSRWSCERGVGTPFWRGKVTVLRKPYGTSLWNHLDDSWDESR